MGGGKTSGEWVEEAYRAFIADADGLDPTDPVKALEEHFRRNASPELKARCLSEGKTAAKCWTFVQAVARKALKGSSGHIDPAAVYAVAMHWFQDVPADWDQPERRGPTAEEKAKAGAEAKRRAEERAKAEAERKARLEAERAAKEAAENPLGLDDERREEAPGVSGARPEPKKDRRKARRGKPQGFFFDLMDGDGAGEAETDGKGDGDGAQDGE